MHRLRGGGIRVMLGRFDRPRGARMASALRVSAGLPFPLGATWDGSGVNVAVFSANATRIELCLFDAEGRRETDRIALPEFTHEVWHGFFPDLRPGQLYGL